MFDQIKKDIREMLNLNKQIGEIETTIMFCINKEDTYNYNEQKALQLIEQLNKLNKQFYDLYGKHY